VSDHDGKVTSKASTTIVFDRTGDGPPLILVGAAPRRPFGDGSAAKPRPDRTGAAGVVEPLTGREMQVLGLMAVGMSNQEIADELVVVLDTVKKHVGHIFDKLGAANRTQAVARARVNGTLR
jgi:DNA-binding NarL/FixJ family response regulator